LGKAEHERVGGKLAMKRGGWWRLVPVEENEERGRSIIEGWRRCQKFWGGGSLL
jgi:hypothetical protein